MIKNCKKCGVAKPFSGFKKNRTKKFGLDSCCRDCDREYRRRPEVRKNTNAWQRKRGQLPHVKEYNKQYRKKYKTTPNGKDAIDRYFLKKLYGMTVEQYKAKHKGQKERCKICRIHQSKLTRKLAVDHNHKTGKIRGLLCHHCNTALGAFNENEKLLFKAIEYLREYKQ